MAVASLVLGIVAFFIGLVPCLGVWVAVPVGFIGAVLGVAALIKAGTPGPDGAPKPKGMAIAGSVVSVAAMLVAVVWFLTQAAAVGASAAEGQKVRAQQAAAPVQAMPVPLTTLLSEYKDNEIRADSRFKGKFVAVSGVVGDIKKDILNDVYLTIGTGKQFEIPVVQCFVADGEEAAAAALTKGTKVSAVGRVDGLMMNVLLRECRIE